MIKREKAAHGAVLRVRPLDLIHRQSNTFLKKLYWITQIVVELKESKESNVIAKQMHQIFKYIHIRDGLSINRVQVLKTKAPASTSFGF